MRWLTSVVLASLYITSVTGGLSRAADPDESDCTLTSKETQTLQQQLWQIGEQNPAASKGWETTLHQIFQRLGSCLDGDVSEDYSTALNKQLARKGSNWGNLFTLMRQDTRFETYVLRTAGSGELEQEELQAILSASEKTCPSTDVAYCQKIKAQVKNALSER